jgi:hypothetical protein
MWVASSTTDSETKASTLSARFRITGTSRLCYVRGPEGVIVELAEQIAS